MIGPWLKVSLFVLTLVALFVWAGEVVSRASGSTRRVAPGEEITVANGELIFWDPGKCHTCHAVGTRGSSVRGPNLGNSADGDAMMIRAASRASERSAALGREMSPTEYLMESLVDPSAHLVPGFKDEMPIVYEPPIRLDPDELTSVTLYLQSLGGQPDVALITVPPEVRLSYRDAPAEIPWQPYLEGDSARGRELFFDPNGPTRCAGCHRIGEEGGTIGPELTSVAGTRTIQSIVESLVEPSASIPVGYETELIETADGRILDGLVIRETIDSLWLATALEEVHVLAREEVARRRTQETSLMPNDLADILSVRQLHDLVAYLRTLE
jgi:putative heme-binding domain-containing protein